MPPPGAFCALPGSVVFTPQGPEVVPGSDASTPSLDWLNLPVGFCAHFFATVPNARQLRVAPDGHLFVASPTTGTTGGGAGGLASIVVVPDDNADGLADQVIPTSAGSRPRRVCSSTAGTSTSRTARPSGACPSRTETCSPPAPSSR
jgi:hypothetical protein